MFNIQLTGRAQAEELRAIVGLRYKKLIADADNTNLTRDTRLQAFSRARGVLELLIALDDEIFSKGKTDG